MKAQHLGKTFVECKVYGWDCSSTKAEHFEGALQELRELLVLHTNENWSKSKEKKEFDWWAKDKDKGFQKYCAELISKTLGLGKTES